MYAGMTIKCDKGCGTYDDPDMQSIWSILEHATQEAFCSVFAIDAAGDAELLHSPVLCNDSGYCERWDWKVTNGVRPSDNNLICYKEMWIKDYHDFLEVARMLRKAGKRVSLDAPEAHIPLEEFVCRSHLNGN